MVSIKASQKLFTFADVVNLTGICVELRSMRRT
jgi:hypothetical protein